MHARSGETSRDIMRYREMPQNIIRHYDTLHMRHHAWDTIRPCETPL